MLGTREERITAINQLFPIWEEHSLWTMFERTRARFPDSTFLISDQEILTYDETKAKVDHMMKCLMAMGVSRGSHVAIMLYNCNEYIFLTLAIARLGGVKIGVNPSIGKEELHYVLEQADADFLVTINAVDDAMIESLPRMKKVLICTRNKLYESEHVYFIDEIEALCTHVTEEELETASVGAEIYDDLFDITFTSGSTSSPKGVMITHDMLLRSAYGSILSRAFEIGRRLCLPVPLYHNMAYVEGFLTAMLVGGSIVITTQRVTNDILYHMITDHKINDLLTVPTQMMDFFAERDFTEQEVASVHAVYCSAATPPDWVWGKIRSSFRVTDVVAAFGMTEVTASTLQTRPEDPPDYVIRYQGVMKPGGVAGLAEYDGAQTQYVIMDSETHEILPYGNVGEICCRGKQVTKGYYNRPEINATLFDEDGWFHTGDVGIFDTNGYLTFLGRNNDSYKTKGELVLPQYIDGIIGKCDLVRAVSVVGVPHERLQYAGAAFLDCADDEETLREIYRYCKSKMASFQIPQYFIVLPQEEWPRTMSGKNPKFRQKQIAEQMIADGDCVDICTLKN